MLTGLVVIGRNEGERLQACLDAAIAQFPTHHIVYVDSGSTDGSIELAKTLGIAVVELDLSTPFTAARARNTGFRYLCAQSLDLKFIQFVDGDCQLAPAWCRIARTTLENQDNIAIVCGRRRELHPQQSIYNLLCEMEWDTPIGEALACGGDAMIRTVALQQVGGYRDSLIAGEEPELCVRLRQHNWRILRIDADMTWHDARLQHFSQWWQRTVRAGHAYAEGAWLHGRVPERHWVRESMRSWIWGLILPLTLLVTLPWIPWWSLLGSLAYLGLGLKICLNKHLTYPWQASIWYSLFCVVGKVPEAQGQLQFHWHRMTSQTRQILEYK